MNPSLGALSRPVRTVLWWQVVATVALALVGGLFAGSDGALSAALGGAVSVVAGWASAVVAAKKAQSAGGVLIAALKAEAVKIGLIVFLLWLVLATYDDVVPPALFGSFVTTILIFTMAFFVREYERNGSR